MVKNITQDILLLYSTVTDCYYFKNSKTTFVSLQNYRTQDIALANFEAKKVIWGEDTKNEDE